ESSKPTTTATPKEATWHAVFVDLHGCAIFNSDADTWLSQCKTVELEFTTRALRVAMSRWVGRSICYRLFPILKESSGRSTAVDLQDLLLRFIYDNICCLAFSKDPDTLAPTSPRTPSLPPSTAPPRSPSTVSSSRSWSAGSRSGSRLAWRRRCPAAWRTATGASRPSSSSASWNPATAGNYDDLLPRFMKKGTYTDSFLEHVVLNFILADRDTCSVALSWFFWLVSTHSAAERRILVEPATVLTESRGNDPTAWLALHPARLRGGRPNGLPQSSPLGDTPALPVRPRGLQVRHDGRRPPRRHIRARRLLHHVLQLNVIQ
ncbi:hypothetical protein B296_00055535, partial [Ensete ventricosum]